MTRSPENTPIQSEPLADSLLEALLAAHSDALLSQTAVAEMPELLTLTPVQRNEIDDLFALATRLDQTLTPVAVSESFLSQLKAELMRAEPVALPQNALTPAELVPAETIFARWRKLPTGYRIVTGLGGLTLAGITIMAALNRVRSGAAPKAEAGLTLNTVSS